jgi:septal ring factor EnvC (AmiA/AmiB activator)
VLLSRAGRALVGATCLAATIVAAPQQPSEEQKRVNDRLQALRQEADDLARREKTLLVELRQLELERNIRAEIQKDAEAAMKAATDDLADTTAQLDALQHRQAEELPGLRDRLVQLYKLGSGGYVRLLLSVDDVRDLGRAYRTVAALAAMDRERVRAHTSTVQSLREVRAELEARRTRAADLEAKARQAAADAARAVAASTALVDQIDARRDLNAKYVGELQAAQQKLSAAVSALPGTGTAVSIRPFEGALDWPVAGPVIGRFGRDRGSRFGTAITRSGIEIQASGGMPVAAVHDGTVAFAAPFTGFGNLVILDHGSHAYTLYGYLSSIAVTKGTRVTHGARLGSVGAGPKGQPSLYFEVRVDGRAVDPLQWLKPRP